MALVGGMTETSDITIVEGEVMDLLDLEEGLSDWEVRFIESVASQPRITPTPFLRDSNRRTDYDG